MLRTATSSRECLICFSLALVRSISLAVFDHCSFHVKFPGLSRLTRLQDRLTRVVDPLPRQLCLCLRHPAETGEKNQHQNTDAFHSCPPMVTWLVRASPQGGAASRGGNYSSDWASAHLGRLSVLPGLSIQSGYRTVVERATLKEKAPGSQEGQIQPSP
jgi:hypothetical protein